MKIHPIRVVALTLLAPVLWGTTYVTVTELLPPGRALTVAALRVAPAGVLLAGLATIVTGWRPRGADWWRTTAVALASFGAFFPLLVVATQRLPGGVAASTGGLQPLLVALWAWAVVGRRPRLVETAVGVVAALGVAMVVLRGDATIDPVGVAAAVGANLSFSLAVVLTKRFPAPSHRVAAVGWQLVIAALVLVPLALVVDGVPSRPAGREIAGAAHLGLVATALAFVLWFDGIRRLPTVAPSLLGLAAPLTGALLGWLVLGQALSAVQLSGFGLVVGAIAYGATSGGRAATPVVGPADPQAGGPMITEPLCPPKPKLLEMLGPGSQSRAAPVTRSIPSSSSTSVVPAVGGICRCSIDSSTAAASSAPAAPSA